MEGGEKRMFFLIIQNQKKFSLKILKAGGILFALFWMFFLSNLLAQAMIWDRTTLEIAHELRCPTCQGLSVKESNTAISEGMKGEIKNQLGQGKSKAEILKYFQTRYGEWILRTPPQEGMNLSLYWVPILGFFLGLLGLGFFIQRSQKKKG